MELADLQLLGFSENEARVYTALLANPDCTGYEVASLASVPRAKVYEVLAGLERKGVVLASGEDKRRCYQALPASMLINRHRQQTEAALARLKPELARLEAGQSREELRTIRGRRPVLDLVRQLLDTAASRIHLSGLPVDLNALAQPLQAARRRGVREFVLSYGKADLPDINVVEHRVTGTQYLQVAALGRWLGLVVDFDQAVLAQVRDEDSTQAIWTSHPGIMFGIFSWIAHDITMYKFEQLIAQMPGVMDALEPLYRDLQPMWMLSPREGPKEETLAVDATELAATLEQRVSRYCGPAAAIQLNLTGPGGGHWRIRLHAHGGSVTEGKDEAADLVVTMSARDFVALQLDRLPLTAFITEGRIQVSGDLALAAKLQGII